jgi:hypothetical protein
MKLDALEFLADDGHGAIIFETTAERKGRTLRVTSAYAVKFDDQGKQKEGWYCVSDQVAWDRFWADES